MDNFVAFVMVNFDCQPDEFYSYLKDKHLGMPVGIVLIRLTEGGGPTY